MIRLVQIRTVMTLIFSFAPVKLRGDCKSAFSLREKKIILNVHNALVDEQLTSQVREMVEIYANLTGGGSATIYRFPKERKRAPYNEQSENFEPKKEIFFI